MLTFIPSHVFPVFPLPTASLCKSCTRPVRSTLLPLEVYKLSGEPGGPFSFRDRLCSLAIHSVRQLGQGHELRLLSSSLGRESRAPQTLLCVRITRAAPPNPCPRASPPEILIQ